MRAQRATLMSGLAVYGLASVARAQALPSASWRAPAECPAQPVFVAQLEGFLGRPLSAFAEVELTGEIREDSKSGYVARLRVATKLRSEQRELAHRDCAELTEAAALVAALAIDPNLVIPTPTSEPEPAETTTAPTESPPPEPAPEAPVAIESATEPRRDTGPRPMRATRPLHGSIAALGLVGSSVLPRAGAGIGIFGALGSGSFRLAARANYWLPRFQAVSDAAGPGMDLGAWGVGLKACGLPWQGDVTLAACLGPELGDIYGTGNALLDNSRTVHNRWSAIEAELTLSIESTSGIATLLGLELGKTLEAPRYGIRVDGQDQLVFEPPGWTLNGYVGLGLFR